MPPGMARVRHRPSWPALRVPGFHHRTLNRFHFRSPHSYQHFGNAKVPTREFPLHQARELPLWRARAVVGKCACPPWHDGVPSVTLFSWRPSPADSGRPSQGSDGDSGKWAAATKRSLRIRSWPRVSASRRSPDPPRVLARHRDASGRNDVALLGPGYQAKWSGRSFS